MKSRSLTSLYAVASIGALLLTSSALAQPVNWTGPTLTGTALTDFNNSGWSTATNWSTGSIPNTANDVFISGGNMNTTNTDTFHLGGNRTFSSITFNNSSNSLAPALRVAGSNATSAQTRILTLSNNASAGGNIINVVSGANVTFFAYPTSPVSGNFNSALNISLGYNGTANINVDGTSRLQLSRVMATGAFTGGYNKTGEGTLLLQSTSGNMVGNTTLMEGTIQLMANSQNATSGAFGTGTLVLAGGTLSSNNTTARVVQSSSLALNGSSTLGNATNSGALTFNSTTSATLLSDSTLTVASAATISSNLTGAFALTKNGTASLTLSGSANSYSGGTTVNAGTLNGNIGTGALSVASGATYVLDSADRSIAAISGAGNVTLGANTLTTSSSSNSTFSGVLSGTGGLTKSGSGTLTLSGANDYTGTTSVTAGGLIVTGSLAGALDIGASGALSGTNTFANSVSISGTHNPGNSPGIQNFASLTYNTGATVNWELSSNSNTEFANPNAVFDQINVTGALNFAGATDLNLLFNNAGSAVTWSDPFWTTNRSWTLYYSTGMSNFSNLALSTDNWLDSMGNSFNTSLAGASFSLAADGNNVLLNYSAAAIPEPSTYAAMAGLAALGCAFWRRRRAAVAVAKQF